MKAPKTWRFIFAELPESVFECWASSEQEVRLTAERFRMLSGPDLGPVTILSE